MGAYHEDGQYPKEANCTHSNTHTHISPGLMWHRQSVHTPSRSPDTLPEHTWRVGRGGLQSSVQPQRREENNGGGEASAPCARFGGISKDASLMVYCPGPQVQSQFQATAFQR